MQCVIFNLNLHGYTPALVSGDLLVVQKKDCPEAEQCYTVAYTGPIWRLTTNKRKWFTGGRLCISSTILSCPVDQTRNILAKHFISPQENEFTFFLPKAHVYWVKSLVCLCPILFSGFLPTFPHVEQGRGHNERMGIIKKKEGKTATSLPPLYALAERRSPWTCCTGEHRSSTEETAEEKVLYWSQWFHCLRICMFTF